ncbi:DUF305 domain-containing protein [Streptomyces sp. NPDC053367]|uniref:DUF305 domain-containing protein n=1 Tax=Streptomyces sp. NPDC053367 TaxID=3365700 RepID=UPI0037CFCCE7
MTDHNSARRLRRRTAIVSAVAAGGLLLAACGGDDMEGMEHGSGSTASAASTPSPRTPGDNPAPGAFNDTDVTFAQGMIPHHEQALEMSRLADGRASDAEIKTLAGAVEQAQDPEIRTMRSWLKSWGRPESADAMPGMHHGSGGGMDHSAMSGMMSDEDMKKLEAARGTDFDRMFAEMMIEHHEGAITMAQDEQKNGRNATAKKLAGDVVRNQSAEVDRFQEILGRL